MNTITIDSRIYDNAAAYAKRHKTSLRHLVENYMTKLITEDRKDPVSPKQYYISPAVKALETGFQAPDGLSYDYKKEIADHKDSKYL